MAKDEKTPSVLDNPNTVVFVPSSSLDQELIRTYLERNAPKVLTDSRMIDTADIASFNPQQMLVCIYRNPRISAYDRMRDEDNRLVDALRPRAELLSELIVSQPVSVADFWVKTVGMRAGTIDVNKLLNAVNAICVPYRLFWRDAASPVPRLLGLRLV